MKRGIKEFKKDLCNVNENIYRSSETGLFYIRKVTEFLTKNIIINVLGIEAYDSNKGLYVQINKVIGEKTDVPECIIIWLNSLRCIGNLHAHSNPNGYATHTPLDQRASKAYLSLLEILIDWYINEFNDEEVINVVNEVYSNKEIVIKRKDTGKSLIINMKKDRVYFGRVHGDYIINHKHISRANHFCIICENKNYYIKELDSTNGVKLDNQNLETNKKYLLKDDNKLSIGALNIDLHVITKGRYYE